MFTISHLPDIQIQVVRCVNVCGLESTSTST